MSAQYDQAPEVAPQNYPEVASQHHGASPHYGSPQLEEAAKPEAYTGGSTYAGTAPTISPYPAVASPYSQQATLDQDPSAKRSKGVLCGCSLLVLVLSCIIAILSAAVIGLAAGTGVEANRANDATSRLAALNTSGSAATATKTVTASAPTATPFNKLDGGCSDNPNGVSGTQYTSFPLLGNTNFTIYCNRDAPGDPFMSLFTANMYTCIDACSAYSIYTPKFFGSGKNTTCGGISFIPLWTNLTAAKDGTAPGNCYLKPTPQNVTGLNIPNIGTECHAAILTE